MRVCVLGAGIAGLAAAYALMHEGHFVTVVDAAQTPGAGASGGNGAQLSYDYVQPLAGAAIWGQLPHLLLAADSPLKLKLRADPHQWRWLVAFMAACNEKTSQSTTAALLALAVESRAGFEAMRADIKPDCDFSAAGKLVLYDDAAALAGAARQVQFQRTLGSEQRVVTAQECAAIEPALAAYAGRIAGAVFTPGECAADCLAVCAALAGALQKGGVTLALGAKVTGVVRKHAGDVVAIETASGPVAADAFVCSLGAGSQQIASKLGLRLALYPLKGYSLTLAVAGLPDAAPRVSVTDSARKMVFARIGTRLRIAGMAELSGHDLSIADAPIDALRRATLAIFPDTGAAVELQRWAGLRPATPTGRPILGPRPGGPSNFLFNTGHGALGFTLAFGTAARIARMLRPAALASSPA